MIVHPGGNSFTEGQKCLHFTGITKESPEFPVSSAQPAWERIQRGLQGPAPLIVDSVAHTPPPRSHKWKQPFVRGEWSRFTVDGPPTKDQATVTTGPGSAACTFTQYDLTPSFTQPLMQTQPQHSLSIHTLKGLSSVFLDTVATQIESKILIWVSEPAAGPDVQDVPLLILFHSSYIPFNHRFVHRVRLVII